MDEIYICDICLYECICHDGMQKKIFAVLGHFAECCTRQRTPLPSAMVTTLGKAGKMGDQKIDFPALPSACRVGTRQRVFFKKIKIFAERLEGWHSAKKIFKKK